MSRPPRTRLEFGGRDIHASVMRWDHFTTVRRALWIGGGQWAGKSTVAGILADRFGLTHYHYDYHDARGHWDRRTARWCREGSRPPDPGDWMTLTVPEAVAGSLESFVERFEFVLDDLRALQSPRPILAEGWGLRPELVAPVTSSIGRMVVLVPTEEFRQAQMTRLPRAAALARPAADPEAAQRRRVERDRLIADDAVRNARRLGVRVIEVDGSRDANGMADIVADHFLVFL
jgi:2-phosphoglycerate kinase